MRCSDLQLEIPYDHPWVNWLNLVNQQPAAASVRVRGEVRVVLNGIEQRFSIVEAASAWRGDDLRVITRWKMYGQPCRSVSVGVVLP